MIKLEYSNKKTSASYYKLTGLMASKKKEHYLTCMDVHGDFVEKLNVDDNQNLHQHYS